MTDPTTKNRVFDAKTRFFVVVNDRLNYCTTKTFQLSNLLTYFQ